MMPAVSVAALRTRLTPASSVHSAAATDAAAPAPRPWKALVLGCLALAALSLLLRRSRPTTRGRGSSGAARSCTSTSSPRHGPSWKPLPVIFTTPFSLLGDDGAPLACGS